MRIGYPLAIALFGVSAIGIAVADPWHAAAQTSDPDDDDDEDGASDGDDDGDVPDPDDGDTAPDPGDDPADDPGADPGDDPSDDPGGDPGADPADPGGDPADSDDGGNDPGGDAPGPGGDDGADDAPGGGGAADDDDGPGAAPGGEGDDDDDAPAAPGGGTGDDDDDDGAPAAPGGGTGDDDDDDGAPAAPGGGTGDDDDDDGAPAAPGGGTTSDDDDDDAPASPAAPAGGGAGDDDDDDDAPAPAPSGPADDDDAGDNGGDAGPSGGPVEFIGDEEITGGGDESEAERLALDERDGIETDREGFRYRSHEFVALDLDADDVARLRANGFELLSSDRLDRVGGTVHLLRGPARVSDEAALSLIEDVADPGSLSFNHLFDSTSARVRRVRAPSVPAPRNACGCQVGLIDTGVAGGLASFRHVTVEQRAFNGAAVAPRLHGTAIAHLFAGDRARAGRPTRIVVADIFSGQRGSAGSTYALVRALDWLAARNIAVINVSLAGPRNPVVAATVARLSERGHVIVAAAGNDGPAAPPVFPGAYQNVVAVTAVDDSQRIYRYANRGNYVDFAARGVNVPAINARGEATAATGTSFAAPVVAARLAAQIRTVGTDNVARAIALLTSTARDLGEPGRDSVYGHGLVPEE